MKKLHKLWVISAMFAVTLSGCRKDNPVLPKETEQLPKQTVTSIKGLYLLNEGNMNANKASLDYYDYATGEYHRNIYEWANPKSVLGLGDVGNNLAIYGSKLYAVISGSNKVEVMDVKTAKRLKVIDIKNCRYITFANGKAYVSAYDGEVQLGEISPNGFIAEIDTTALNITRTVPVGRQPEEMAVVGNKLYVANSGGYTPEEYETTVSVIDLGTFKKIKDIEVAINLNRIKADAYGNLYVGSHGDYFEIPSRLYVIDTQTDMVKKSFDIACSNLTIAGDTVYIIGSEFSYATFEFTNSYSMINVKSQTLLEESFLPQAVSNIIKFPYGIAVDPVSTYIYVTDALDFTSPGKLYCINKAGSTLFTVTAGDIPAHIAFVYKNK